MNDQQFDRIARLLSSAGSRRRALAAVGALALARTIPASAASQIETAACGEAGAVCTQIKGCCSGLVCATSYTNPTYGVCVTGEGDMLAVSDDIVVPGADGVTDELAQLVTGATGTDAESVLAEQEAEIQARKDARRLRNDTQQSNRRSNRSTQQSRRALNHGDTQGKKLANQTEKRTAAQIKRDARALKRKPQLALRFSDNITSKPESLRVQNRDDVTVVISRIESILDHRVFKSLSISLLPDGVHLLDSGPNAKTKDGVNAWTVEEICTAPDSGEGVYLTVAKSGATKKHRLKVLCS